MEVRRTQRPVTLHFACLSLKTFAGANGVPLLPHRTFIVIGVNVFDGILIVSSSRLRFSSSHLRYIVAAIANHARPQCNIAFDRCN
eukprot:scaffold31_cov334-Pavlova_lutheri.AAC.14